MALDYLTPSEVAEQYLTVLKTLKPEVNTSQTDSDWWVRSRVLGGVFSGLYADQKRISNDAFPQSARREALLKHLNLYFDEGFTPAQQAEGLILVTGLIGTVIPAGTQFEYEPNGNIYAATGEFTLAATGQNIAVVSIDSGQDQNLLTGAALTAPSPPAGLNAAAAVVSPGLIDGRDEETNEQASGRVLRQVRTPLAGGKEADYEAFALAADDSVTSATVLRYPFGFGTVGVVITAGTTDIDAALDAGEPIVLVPSESLVAEVQNYIETQNPITDCAYVLQPATASIDVTVNVRYASGDNNTVPAGQTLTQEALVQREIQRAIYKTPPGGRKFGASGFVLASELEEVIDIGLSADPYTVGNYAEILVDRHVDDLSATGYNRMIAGNEIPIPGTITVVPMS